MDHACPVVPYCAGRELGLSVVAGNGRLDDGLFSSGWKPQDRVESCGDAGGSDVRRSLGEWQRADDEVGLDGFNGLSPVAILRNTV